MKDYFVQTARLGFSRWTENSFADAEALWGDPDVAKYISASGAFTKEQIHARLLKEIENERAFAMQYWPVTLLETGEFAGCCGLRPHEPEKNIPELGIHLMRSCWGLGLAEEACRAVIGFAFGKLGVPAIFAGHNPGNAASARLLRKLGFVYTHDEYYAPTGLMHPSYLLARQDFESSLQS